MSLRRPAHDRQRAAYGSGILVLILGLVHTPLPQPDFHNIRHHDGAGEVCEHHDHLLRWHPGAGIADDVAILHWHWFLPTADPFDLAPGTDGPAAHAHIVDWQASTWGDDRPVVSAAATGRVLGSLESPPRLAESVLRDSDLTAVRAPGVGHVRAFSATFAPRAPLACLFQRWTC